MTPAAPAKRPVTADGSRHAEPVLGRSLLAMERQRKQEIIEFFQNLSDFTSSNSIKAQTDPPEKAQALRPVAAKFVSQGCLPATFPR